MTTEVDQLWVLVAAAMIFFMQAGFLALEVGLVRPRNASITAMKSVVDWMVVSILWLAIGFGFAFGETAGGFIGTSFWFGDGLDRGDGSAWILFLFQLGFAATAVTIVSGAMAERVGFHTYVICSCVNGAVLYPIVAHWVWGNQFLPQDTWLSAMGFHDFAGSTAVHTVGGSISLVSIWVLGPRLGRFDAEGRPRPVEITSMWLAALGVFILWFGWWGFNGGSKLGLEGAGQVIVNTNVAGCSAALVAWMHARWSVPDRDVEAKFLGGALAGLVAITAGADVVSPTSALAIGLIAGLVHNVAFELLLKLRLDDPVGAVPVHLGGGILGTVCVGVFGKSELLPKGRSEQVFVQLFGCLAVAAFCMLATYVLLVVLRKTIGLRVSPRAESEGVTLCRMPDEPVPTAPDAETLRKMMGG